MVFTASSTPQLIAALQAEQTVEQYFQAFNQGNFGAIAQLFTEDGALHPPFEAPMVGQSAIEAYLKKEAVDMQATPKELLVTSLPGDHRQVVVKGTVKAIVFTVNTAWVFELDSCDRICQVQVKLLASLQDLLALRP